MTFETKSVGTPSSVHNETNPVAALSMRKGKHPKHVPAVRHERIGVLAFFFIQLPGRFQPVTQCSEDVRQTTRLLVRNSTTATLRRRRIAKSKRKGHAVSSAFFSTHRTVGIGSWRTKFKVLPNLPQNSPQLISVLVFFPESH